MNLVIDIGNTACKAGVFEKGEKISARHWPISDIYLVPQWLDAYPGIEKAIVSSVRNENDDITGSLEKTGINVLILDDKTPLPIINKYKSTSTLGRDRIAAAVGANSLFPGRNLLVIDAGTAITIDLVTAENEYLGGNISPGLSMRFRALNRLTDSLPLVEPAETSYLFGEKTEDAIRAGVQYGIIFELDEYINRQKKRYSDLQVIMTGGDAAFFDKKLKNSIFMDLDLNLHGLQRILDYNVGK
jgi:type III pantothenate kinase